MESPTMQVPAHIAERMEARKAGQASSDIMGAVISSDGPSVPRISIKAAKYRLIEAGVETPVGDTLDVVIVGVNPNTSKVFFSQAYDGTEQRPSCASDDGVKPNEGVPEPVAESCALCPNNVLGSKINPSGAKSKLCADQRHLAVVPAGDPSKVYNLTLTVSAMKPLREYFKHLQNYGTVPEEVVTELGFDPQASFPKVTFKMKNFLGEKAVPVIDRIVQSDEAKAAVRLMPPVPVAPTALPDGQEIPQIGTEAPVKAVPIEEEPAPVVEPAPDPAPVAEPVKEAKPQETKAPESISELEDALDSLFD